MEVSKDNFSSIYTIIEVLLDKGLPSKQPKIIINSMDSILNVTVAFGVALLPLRAILSHTPKILTHAIVKVRESGINIIAEIYCDVGSKSFLQNIFN